MMGLPLFCENRRNEPQVLSLLVLLEGQLPGLQTDGLCQQSDCRTGGALIGSGLTWTDTLFENPSLACGNRSWMRWMFLV
jgi:hypothetical protein